MNKTKKLSSPKRRKKTTNEELDTPEDVQYDLNQADTKEYVSQLFSEGRIEYKRFDY